VAFVATALVVSDFYSFRVVLWPVPEIISNTVIFGILLNHFWLDAHFWRFKDADSRKWMIGRYPFLFDR
jgi:hypothetical protein